MSIFGRTDKDLHFLRLCPAELKAAKRADVHDQLNHHCIRLSWREHARTGAPVRDVLGASVGAAYIRLNEVDPDDDFNDELLSIFIDDAQADHLRTCTGFFLDNECRTLCRAVLVGPFPPPNSIFGGRAWALAPYLTDNPTRLQMARAALLKLQDLWNEYRCNVATNPLVRETVRIVANATRKDPQLSQTLILDRRLCLLAEWIAEYEPGSRGALRAV